MSKRRYTKLELEKVQQTLEGRLSDAFAGLYDELNEVKEFNIREMKKLIKETDINDLIELRWKDFYVNLVKTRGGYAVEVRSDFRNHKIEEYSEMYENIMNTYDEGRAKIEPLRKKKMQEIEEFMLRLIMGEELDELEMPDFSEVK